MPNRPIESLCNGFDASDLTVPSFGITFGDPTPADLYPTDVYTLEYDGFADFPQYPIDPTQIQDAIPLETLPSAGNGLSDYFMIPVTDLPAFGKPPYPVIIWVHGGTWMYGDKNQECLACDELLGKYAVASVNYRLDTESSFPSQIKDLKAFYGLELDSAASHRLVESEAEPKPPAKRAKRKR